MCHSLDDQLALDPDQTSAAHIPTSGGLLTVPEQKVAISVVPVMERLLQIQCKPESQLTSCCNAWQHDQAQAALINEQMLLGMCDSRASMARPGRSPLHWWMAEPDKVSASTSFSFNVFELAAATDNTPLSVLGLYLLKV